MPADMKTKSGLDRITTAHGARKEPKAPHEEYNVQVIADDSGKWYKNHLRFTTVDTARAYAVDLMHRWTLMRAWRIVNSKGEVQVETHHDN